MRENHSADRFMAVVLWVVLIACTAFGLSGYQTPTARTYWPVAIAALKTTTHTHVSVTGTVTLVRHENDGDLHIRLSDSTGHFAVAECIPELPCRTPRLGERVTVKGISRWDPEHLWSEVHPVEHLSP